MTVKSMILYRKFLCLLPIKFYYGHMAQLGLEHRSPKPNIEGSNPSMPVKYY